MEEGRGFQTLVPVISDLRFQLNKPKTGKKKNATTVLLLFVAPKLLSLLNVYVCSNLVFFHLIKSKMITPWTFLDRLGHGIPSACEKNQRN